MEAAAALASSAEAHSGPKSGPVCLSAPEQHPFSGGDQLAIVKALIEGNKLSTDAFIDWRAQPTDPPKRRTLAMVAAFHGCVDVLQYLLATGCDANIQSPDDGATALHCAATGGSPKTLQVIQMLLSAGGSKDIADNNGKKPVDLLAALLSAPQTTEQAVSKTTQQPSSSSAQSTSSEDGAEAAAPADSESASQYDGPEYKTPEFRMYRYKIEECQRSDTHDWTECPFAHPSEKARRRCLKQFEYTSIACPDFRKGTCKRGDHCEFAHGVFECWLHPNRYRTQICKDGPLCTRKVCFFAHSLEELRQPAGTDLAKKEEALQQRLAEAEAAAAAASPDGTGAGVSTPGGTTPKRATSPAPGQQDGAAAAGSTQGSGNRSGMAAKAGGTKAGQQQQPLHPQHRSTSPMTINSNPHSSHNSRRQTPSGSPRLPGPLSSPGPSAAHHILSSSPKDNGMAAAAAAAAANLHPQLLLQLQAAGLNPLAAAAHLQQQFGLDPLTAAALLPGQPQLPLGVGMPQGLYNQQGVNLAAALNNINNLAAAAAASGASPAAAGGGLPPSALSAELARAVASLNAMGYGMSPDIGLAGADSQQGLGGFAGTQPGLPPHLQAALQHQQALANGGGMSPGGLAAAMAQQQQQFQQQQQQAARQRAAGMAQAHLQQQQQHQAMSAPIHRPQQHMGHSPASSVGSGILAAATMGSPYSNTPLGSSAMYVTPPRSPALTSPPYSPPRSPPPLPLASMDPSALLSMPLSQDNGTLCHQPHYQGQGNQQGPYMPSQGAFGSMLDLCGMGVGNGGNSNGNAGSNGHLSPVHLSGSPIAGSPHLGSSPLGQGRMLPSDFQRLSELSLQDGPARCQPIPLHHDNRSFSLSSRPQSPLWADVSGSPRGSPPSFLLPGQGVGYSSAPSSMMQVGPLDDFDHLPSDWGCQPQQQVVNVHNLGQGWQQQGQQAANPLHFMKPSMQGQLL